MMRYQNCHCPSILLISKEGSQSALRYTKSSILTYLLASLILQPKLPCLRLFVCQGSPPRLLGSFETMMLGLVWLFYLNRITLSTAAVLQKISDSWPFIPTLLTVCSSLSLLHLMTALIIITNYPFAWLACIAFDYYMHSSITPINNIKQH